MRWLAIINPHADHHSEDDLHRLDRQLRRQLGADCLWTNCPNNATALVRDHPEYDGFIAVGGDGTIAEVLSGVTDGAHCVGIIPAGTGNGLARDLHLPIEASAWRTLVRPRISRLDSIAVAFRRHDSWDRRRMISTSGVGFVAGAVETGYGHLRRWGVYSEAIGAFLQTFCQRPFQVRLSFDDAAAVEQTLTTLVVHNTQFAGPFRLFPEAQVDDGRLNVLCGCFSPLRQLAEDVNILLGSHVLNGASHRQACSLEVELPRPDTLMVDGFLYHDVDAIRYEIEPASWSCCVGPLDGANEPGN